MPRFAEILKSGWHFPLPIVFLIATLVWPEISGSRSSARRSTPRLMIVVLRLDLRLSRQACHAARDARAVLDTGLAALDIVLIGAAAGMVVGALSVSGISFGLTLQLIALSGDNLFCCSCSPRCISIMLGMGMPTVSVYVLTATLLAPSLVKLGVTPMAAHMFVMYFGMLSMITPPVAIAAYAAANIARVPGWKTGWTAVAGGLEHVLHPVPVRARAEPADGGSGVALGVAIRAQPARHLVGTAAVIGYGLRPLSPVQRALFGARGARHPHSAECVPGGASARLARPRRRARPARLRVPPP